LTFPAVSFLTFLSPLAYLSLLKTVPSSSSPLQSTSKLPILDIPLAYLRERLSTHPRPKGVTIATLAISQPPKHDRLPSIEIDDNGTGRPTFVLAQPESNRTFPQLPAPPQNTPLSDESYTWTLDFTTSGKYPGVVMSQSRMRMIECILDPSAMGMDDVGMMGFGGGQGLRSWVDLLVRIPASLGTYANNDRVDDTAQSYKIRLALSTVIRVVFCFICESIVRVLHILITHLLSNAGFSIIRSSAPSATPDHT
jgi:hypothetical protein